MRPATKRFPGMWMEQTPPRTPKVQERPFEIKFEHAIVERLEETFQGVRGLVLRLSLLIYFG
jgi:hypothetical protein